MPPSLEYVLASDRLPSLPQVALRVVQLAQVEEPDFAEVTSAVRVDPALSGKILRTANSALFGLKQNVESIESAVPILGVTLLRTIVLSFSLASGKDAACDPKSLRRLWRSCLTQAVFAEFVANEFAKTDAATFFLAGLLQDIGVLALLSVDGEDYKEEVWRNSDFSDFVAREREYLGYTHVDVSAALCRRWGLSDALVAAVGMHHHRCFVEMTPDLEKLTVALRAASLCAEYVENQHKSGDRRLRRLLDFLRDHFEWSYEDADDILSEVLKRVDEIAALFSFDIGDGYVHDRILQDAKRILADIALQSQMEVLRLQQEASENPSDAINRDPMTGVYNRRFLERELQDRLGPMIRDGLSLGFLFLDIDRFKYINDNYGHKTGDEAIRKVGEILNDSFRETDYVIRYGGDEFLVVLTSVGDTQVVAVAERVRQKIEAARLSEHPAFEMTTSIGALLYHPEEGQRDMDPNWLIDHVDQAMYRAKRQGGNQVHPIEIAGKRMAVATVPS